MYFTGPVCIKAEFLNLLYSKATKILSNRIIRVITTLKRCRRLNCSLFPSSRLLLVMGIIRKAPIDSEAETPPITAVDQFK